MRILLCVAIIFLCSYAGYAKERRLRLRAALMERFGADVRLLAAQAEYRRQPLADMLEHLDGSLPKWFWTGFARRLSCGDAAAAWAQALDEAQKRDGGFSCMKEEERRLLGEFGAGFCRGDLEGQRRFVRYYAEQVDACAADARRELSGAGAIYARLGVLAGMAAAVLVY